VPRVTRVRILRNSRIVVVIVFGIQLDTLGFGGHLESCVEKELSRTGSGDL
jgi:hypothetical protein